MFYPMSEVLHKQPGIESRGAMPVGYCALQTLHTLLLLNNINPITLDNALP
jgi:hypothetical protein